jgi:hypothetical protein
MSIIKIRDIYTINVSSIKGECGDCGFCDCIDYKNPKFRCFLFKTNLIQNKISEGFGIQRCKKCLKGEVRK